MERFRRSMRPAARRCAALAIVLAAATARGPFADSQGPASEQRQETQRQQEQKRWPPGKLGKVILDWDHLVDSNDRTFEDFWAFVAYKQAHFQAWSGEFTDGAEVGGYVRDHRRSTYAGLLRYRNNFDNVAEFDTEQVLAKGWVSSTMLRGIHILHHDAKEDAAALTDERVGPENQLQFGTGFDWYYGNWNFLSFRAVSDPREGGRWSTITSNRFQWDETSYVQPGFIIRTDNSTGWFLQGKIKYFRWGVGKYDRFDFAEVDRTIYSAGVEIPF